MDNFPHYSVICTVFNPNNVEHLASSKFYMIKDRMWILLWEHDEMNSFNGGVLAYKVNSLMMVVATTETRQNMDWMCKNFRISKCMVHTVGNKGKRKVHLRTGHEGPERE